jgi:hypothetical protein
MLNPVCSELSISCENGGSLNILNLFSQLLVDSSVDESVQTGAVLWDFWCGFNHELIDDVMLLVDTDFVEISEECTMWFHSDKYGLKISVVTNKCWTKLQKGPILNLKAAAYWLKL